MRITGHFPWLHDAQPGDDPPAPVDGAPTHEQVRAAARWAICAATSNGSVADFDPDAMVQNFEYALLGSGRCAVFVER